MRYFKYCLILGVLLLFVSQENATTSKVASSDWSINAIPSVVDLGFSKEDIAHFINKYRKKELKELFGEEEKLDEYEGIKVGDFIWEDIDKDGYYELLVTTATSRCFFNSLSIYKSISNEKVPYQSIEVWMLDKLDRVLEDLDNDGYQELILPILITEYRGVRPFALWTAIYKWNGEKFQEASEQFNYFYRTVLLPKVEHRIIELEEEMRKYQSELDSLRDKLGQKEINYVIESLEESLSAEWIIRDKIYRLLGDEPLAGLERAKQWAKSPNSNLRGNAIVVFEEIKDEESLSYLELLSQDSNPIVAWRAQQTLKKIKK